MNTVKTIGRVRGDRYMRITATIRDNDARGLSDGFSVTGELYEPRGTWSGEARWRNGRDMDAAGMLHAEIAEFAPELLPVIAVHLADLSGRPMHAVANGWYFYCGAASAADLRGPNFSDAATRAEYFARMGTDYERAARALHVDVADIPDGMDKEEFVAYVERFKGRWAQQARRARAAIDAMDAEAEA